MYRYEDFAEWLESPEAESQKLKLMGYACGQVSFTVNDACNVLLGNAWNVLAVIDYLESVGCIRLSKDNEFTNHKEYQIAR